MSVKKINEENLVSIYRKIKKLPITKQNMVYKTLTKEKLLQQIKDLPEQTPIILSSTDHSYVSPEIVISTALFSNTEITEDYGEDLTPESSYGIRKTAIIIS